MPLGPDDRPDDRDQAEAPTLHGLAVCLAMLEIEARALGQKLAAALIAAASEALRDPAVPHRPPVQPAPRPTEPADPRRD